MSQTNTSHHLRLGLFVLAGLGCLVAVLFLLGRKQSLFSESIIVQADFRNVSGLLKGNNVRLGGIPVGTVRNINIINDSTVRVVMNLDEDVQRYVKKNTVAAIGTDGLVGNTLVNLVASQAPAPPVQSGDQLPTSNPVSIDQMLSTLSLSNRNLVGITSDLRQITSRLNADNALWQLLDDKSLPAEVRKSIQSVSAAAAHLQDASRDVNQITQSIRQGKGPAGYLLNDTSFSRHLGHAAMRLSGTSDSLAATVAGLKKQLNTPSGPLNTLLADTTAGRKLRESLDNVEKGTEDFSKSMEALQHNFLLRGYFKRQQKKREKQGN